MKKIVLLSLVSCFLLVSCERKAANKEEKGVAYEYYADGKVKTETQVKDTLAHGLRKTYDRDGNLMSVYTFNMSKLDGPAVTYYTNGKVEQKMVYKNGRREGRSQWFYSTGELFRLIPYKDGKINGTKISYYKDGKIMAEAPVLNDMAGIGLKEYTMKGELIKDDTKIIVLEDNRLFADSKYILTIKLSKPQHGTNFYLGDLIDGKYISLNQWQIPAKDGIATYTISLEKGRFRMETLVFTASYKTDKSNYRVISRTYNLAVDNK